MMKLLYFTISAAFLLSCSDKKTIQEVSVECETYYNAKKYEKAFKACLKDAKNGVPLAQTRVGHLYLKGQGVDRINDFTQGEGIDKSEKEAIFWFTKAAEQEFNNGYLSLFSYYSDDKNKFADKKKAYEWLKKSAEKANSQSYYMLGNLYYDGKGVSQSHEKALNLFKKAAEVGDTGGEFMIGIMYYKGEGLQQDDYKAFSILHSVAEKNEKNSQSIVSKMYIEGIGVARNDSLAYMWSVIAAKNGDNDSSAYVKMRQSEISTEQLNVLNKLVEECLSKDLKNCNETELPIYSKESVSIPSVNPKVEQFRFDTNQICKAAISQVMGRNLSIINVDQYRNGITYLSYTKDDHTFWQFRCRIGDNNSIIWASEPGGRWRTDPKDSKLFFEIYGKKLIIYERYSDGSLAEKAFDISSL